MLQLLRSHLGAYSCPGSSTIDPVPCVWPRKAVDGGSLMPSNPKPTWKTSTRLLAPGFKLAQLRQSCEFGVNRCMEDFSVFSLEVYKDNWNLTRKKKREIQIGKGGFNLQSVPFLRPNITKEKILRGKNHPRTKQKEPW